MNLQVPVSVEYVPNPTSPTPSQIFNDENVLFGIYKVVFPDGWTVSLPHTGWPNTISAEPLDLEDDEQRTLVIDTALKSRVIQ